MFVSKSQSRVISFLISQHIDIKHHKESPKPANLLLVFGLTLFFMPSVGAE